MRLVNSEKRWTDLQSLHDAVIGCRHGDSGGPLGSRSVRAWLTLLITVAMTVIVTSASSYCPAQDAKKAVEEEEDDEASLTIPLGLLERAPFDRITLDAANGNTVLDVEPVENVPVAPKPTDRLQIRLLVEPGQLYEVQWQHIARFASYQQLLFDEAQRLTREKKFDEAFPYYDYLLHNTTTTPGLKAAVMEYLFENASVLVSEQNYQHALAILEEIARRDPHFRSVEVSSRLAVIAESLITAEVERGDYRKARGVIERLDKEYGGQRIATLASWRQRLIDEATSLREQARQHLQQGAFREAEQASRRMIRIWPDLPGAEQLRQEIAQRYPMVIVGVSQRAGTQDVTSIDSWPARRTGGLTQRTLLKFIGAGPEGGQYLCPLGDYYQSDDRRQLTVELTQQAESLEGVQVTGYDISKHVLSMADPASPRYDPSWASLARGVAVQDVFKVQIELRRPHVLPEAMLQIRLDKNSDPDRLSPGDGPYQLAESSDDDLHFVVNRHYPFPGEQHPSEIVERYFATSEDAIAALRRGDIDVIDYAFPDDAARLGQDDTLRVVPYDLPTIHALIPSYRNPFTANEMFRRALLYGIDRQRILTAELLGNQKIPGCQVLSGPFPVGTRDNDPLAYAYDSRITPHAYNPRLAILLKTLAERQLRETALKRKEAIPENVKLVIGYPGSQIARVSCQAIAQYLQVVGIETELRELPPGTTTDPKGDVDLLYVQVAMWEPVIDARRLLAPDGVAAVGNEYVGMALRRLDTAKNWREARERLHELHRIVHEQVAVIPLWQTVNYLVYTHRLQGIGPRPLTLYQNVEQWRVGGQENNERE